MLKFLTKESESEKKIIVDTFQTNECDSLNFNLTNEKSPIETNHKIKSGNPKNGQEEPKIKFITYSDNKNHLEISQFESVFQPQMNQRTDNNGDQLSPKKFTRKNFINPPKF